MEQASIDYMKTILVILSCENINQMTCAKRMIYLFLRKYNWFEKKFLNDLKTELLSIYNNKSDKFVWF